MARLSRVVVPDVPHHVTQRGNRRQPTFFCDADYRLYITLMAHWCHELDVEIWAYCLMPNHVHLIAVPHTEPALAAAVGEAHRRYSRSINKREGWTGHLWQSRFASFPMDEVHLHHAARYVEQNPVTAGLCRRAEEYEWSSARAHLAEQNDQLVNVDPLLSRIGDWHRFLETATQRDEIDRLEKHQRTGRPLGSDPFVKELEDRLNRRLRPRKPGPRSKT